MSATSGSGPMLHSAEAWIERLNLKPLEFEGGYYREQIRSNEEILAPGRSAPRPLHTAIYYLLTPDTCSAMHRLANDEVFHFYAGDRVRMLQLGPAGQGRSLLLGNDGAPEVEPQLLVPRGTWQGSALEPGGAYALLGTTMAPGFDFRDFELGHYADLCAQYPAFDADLRRLCKA